MAYRERTGHGGGKACHTGQGTRKRRNPVKYRSNPHKRMSKKTQG